MPFFVALFNFVEKVVETYCYCQVSSAGGAFDRAVIFWLFFRFYREIVRDSVIMLRIL